MKEAILYQKLKNKNVRCLTCQRKCLIAPGQVVEKMRNIADTPISNYVSDVPFQYKLKKS